MSASRGAPVPAAGHPPASPGFRRLSVAVSAAGITTFALLYSTQALLPLLGQHFAVSPAQSALTVSLATLGLGAGLLVAGPLSDAWGRTPLLRASLGASVVVAVATALAPSWPALLVLRTLQGVALAGLPSVMIAYLREEVRPDAHARATGGYIGGTALGGMLGRLVTGGVAELAGWRAALAVIAALAAACALVAHLLLPPSTGFRATPQHPAALLRNLRTALADRVLLALYATGAALMGAFVAVYNALGFRLTAPPYALGVGAASLVFVAYAVGSVASPLAGRIADRRGRGPALRAATLVMAAGLLLTLPVPLAVLVLGVLVLTAAFFAAHGLASGWVSARAHASGAGAGQASSLYLIAYYAGSSAAGALAGGAWEATGWAGVVVLALGSLAVAVVLAQGPLRRAA
ncbi:MAG: MFS transporter [Actinomycetota bacterium]|nr:MFS transporter [Actinomycetota bacterium]